MKRYIVLFIMLVSFFGCKDQAKQWSKQEGQSDPSKEIMGIDKDSVEVAIFEASFDSIQKGVPIFYNMYLTVEMSTLFQSIDAAFNQNLINELDRQSQYLTTSKMAMNLGVYSVDLSYARVFDKVELTGQYLDAMEQLATDLGIPEKFFLSSANRFERNISNKDSLYKIANEVYFTSEKHLKENNRKNASALIVLGGWTEAMYIGTKVIEKNETDIELLDRLVEQKHSLDILIDMLDDHKQDLVVSKYLPKLKRLAETYRLYEINYDEVELSFKDFKKISIIVDEIRTEMVS